MTDIPTLTGQDIGEAAAATRRVLDVLLVETHTTFPGWLVLNSLVISGSPLTSAQLAARMALAPGAPSATEALDDLATAGLISTAPTPAGEGTTGEPATLVTVTPAGEARARDIRQGIRRSAERLYGGLPADDLATAHRVLATVTERANAELGL